MGRIPHLRGTVLVIASLIIAVALPLAFLDSTASREPVARAAALPRCGEHGNTAGSVPAWRMGAVQFFSPTAGIGLTAGSVPCFPRGKTGEQVTLRPQPVRIALSDDGGLSWRLTGRAAPTGRAPLTTVGDQLVAASAQRIWALAGNGHALATIDGGRSWLPVRPPGPAVELTRSAGDVWLVSCPRVRSRTAPQACRPQVWRAPLRTGVWRQVTIPRLTAQDPAFVHLAIASERAVLLGVLSAGQTTGEMAISTDSGRTWRTRPDPSWDGHRCSVGANLAAAAPRTFWLLCLGGAAAGSSTKGLLRSTDAGSTWQTVSAVTSLVRAPRPGSLPRSEPSALAAGSADRVWLSTTNGLAESDDGGRTWSNVPAAFDPAGWSTVLSVLDARHAWLLAPGAGLWRTTDGSRWAAVGPLHTH